VDEAVLVALGERAEAYPYTLLDVSRLAGARPALSLRLIGVVEGKSALKGRIKHMVSRPMPQSARLGVMGVVGLLVLGAVLLPMATGESEKNVTVERDGPLDIRFVGVRADVRDDLLDGQGNKIGELILPANKVDWDAKDMRRDFVFELPQTDGPILFDYKRTVHAAGSDRRLYDSSGNPVFPVRAHGRQYIVLDTRIPRTYRHSVLGLFSNESAVERVDVTLRYYHGPRRKAVFSFTGPFELGQTVKADGGLDYELTVKPEDPERGPGGPRVRFQLSTPARLEHRVPIIVYDKAGNRYLALRRSGSSGRGGSKVEFVLHWDKVPLAEIAAIGAERPSEITLRNVLVAYPEWPVRSHAPYLDEMAQGLGWQGLSGNELAGKQLASVEEALKVLDVARAGGIGRVLEGLRSDKAGFEEALKADEALEGRLAETAGRWTNWGRPTSGIGLGLMTGRAEFFEQAVAFLMAEQEAAAGSVAAGWRRDEKEFVARAMAVHWRHPDEQEATMLKEALLRVREPQVLSLLAIYLRYPTTPALVALCWDLAEDNRASVWWPAVEGIVSRQRERVEDPAALPERLAARVVLVRTSQRFAHVSTKLPEGQAEALRDRVYDLAQKSFDITTLSMDGTGFDLIQAVAQFSDRQVATRIYMDFLEEVRNETGRGTLANDRYVFARISEVVPYIIRIMNVWYGVNLGGVGTTVGPESYEVRPRNPEALQELADEVLRWYEGQEGLEARELLFGGRVTDSTGKGISGAVLTLRGDEEYRDEHGGIRQREVVVGTVRSDGGGAFEFGEELSKRSYELDVEASGYVRRTELWVSRQTDGRYLCQPEWGKDESVVVLERPGRVRGRLVGVDGEPLGGVQVSCFDCEQYSRGDRGQSVKTDEQGQFVVENLASGRHEFHYRRMREVREVVGKGPHRVRRTEYVGPSGVARVALEEGQDRGDVVLDLRESTATLEVEVMDGAGKPLRTAVIHYRLAMPKGTRGYGAEKRSEMVSEDGVYRLVGMPACEWNVTVSHARLRHGGPVKVVLKANKVTRCGVVLEQMR